MIAWHGKWDMQAQVLKSALCVVFLRKVFPVTQMSAWTFRLFVCVSWACAPPRNFILKLLMSLSLQDLDLINWYSFTKTSGKRIQ